MNESRVVKNGGGEKLQSDKYHFQRMEEMYLKDEQKFIYDLEEKLTPEIFENRACQLQKARALNFIQWWKSKMEKFG
ncbi:MAG: hypothetical protein QXO75_00080 [Nitrososphaerota archaeon]